MKPLITRGIKILQYLEDGLLVSMLTTMVVLAAGQIALRNLFNTSIEWGDPLLRVLVLWVALLGAMTATRNNNHIKIDILSTLLPGSWKIWQQRITSLFTSAICWIIAWHAAKFVLLEREDGIILFAQVPAWLCEFIIPLGFTVMGIRFALHVFIPPETDTGAKQ